jgi:hypothetical protein
VIHSSARWTHRATIEQLEQPGFRYAIPTSVRSPDGGDLPYGGTGHWFTPRDLLARRQHGESSPQPRQIETKWR